MPDPAATEAPQQKGDRNTQQRPCDLENEKRREPQGDRAPENPALDFVSVAENAAARQTKTEADRRPYADG